MDDAVTVERLRKQIAHRDAEIKRLEAGIESYRLRVTNLERRIDTMVAAVRVLQEG